MPAAMTRTRADLATAGAPEGLLARGITKHYGGIHALDGVDLHLAPGVVTGLIGPNGAGKTTLLDVLTGVTAPSAGTVSIDGRDVTGMSTHQRADHGLGRSFQGVRLFPHLSTRENIELGALRHTTSARAARQVADGLLVRLELTDWAARTAAGLPYGIARRAGLARCLAARPRYLLLDEPAAGLDEEESLELAEVVATLPTTDGCAVLVIEHSMPFVAASCGTVQVLVEGRTLTTGPVAEVLADPRVIEAYLGSEPPTAPAGQPC
jgi:branched-chain amino acid transport system ATP-binding protein